MENFPIFDELSNKRMDDTKDLNKQIDFNNLSYYFKNKNISPINFIGFRDPVHIFDDIRNCNTSIKKVEEDQKQLKSNLSE